MTSIRIEADSAGADQTQTQTQGQAQSSAGPAPDDSAKWWTLAAVCMGTFMLLLDITIINVALPDIQNALRSSFTALQWVVDAYALTLAAFLLTAGSLADLYGRRKLYFGGLIVFTVASLLCGLAANTLVLQLARGLQGVGGAVMFSVSLALLASAFRGKDRGTAFGIWGAVTGLAVAIGPLLGGALTSGLSWRWIFFINLPIGLATMALVLTKVAESKAPSASRPDWVGFALFTSALALLVVSLIESNDLGFTDTRVLVGFVAAAALLTAFVLWERRTEHPMFDLTLFAKPTFSGGSIAAFGLSSTLFAMLLYLVLYLQNVLGFSAFETGLRLLVLSGGILLTSTVAGRLSARIPVRLLIGPGLGLVGLGLLLMRGLTAESQWTHLVPGLLIAGIGAGMVNPPLASTAVGVVQPQRAGMASGINSTFRQVGIATGIALLGTLFARTVSEQVMAGVAQVPALSGRGESIAAAVESGKVGGLMQSLPEQLRGTVGEITRAAFTSGLDRILLLAAIVALVSAALSFVLIREQDFVSQGGPSAGD